MTTSGDPVEAAVEPAETVDSRRLLLAGALAAVAAAVANEIVRAVAVSVLDVPDGFEPFTPGRPAVFTIVAVALGTGLLAILARRVRRPIHTFRRVAVVLVLVSFLPDVALLVADPFPGVSVATSLVLALMHVVAAVIAIPILTTLPRSRDEDAEGTPT